MKLLGRLLWLLLGLVYRLIALVLFEKWIPFPDRDATPSALPPESKRTKQKPPKDKKRKLSPEQAGRAPRTSGQPRARRERPPSAFSEAESSELAPEVAARLEGEHWLRPRAQRAPSGRATPQRESLAGLLRDKRAIADAVVLTSALGPKRPKF